MWIIKWSIFSKSKSDFLREMFDNGKVLKFEWEEDALRFVQKLKELNTGNNTQVTYTVSRFSGNRNEKYKNVKQSMIDRHLDYLKVYLENL